MHNANSLSLITEWVLYFIFLIVGWLFGNIFSLLWDFSCQWTTEVWSHCSHLSLIFSQTRLCVYFIHLSKVLKLRFAWFIDYEKLKSWKYRSFFKIRSKFIFEEPDINRIFLWCSTYDMLNHKRNDNKIKSNTSWSY